MTSETPRDWLIDRLENVIADSIDVDWTPKAAATEVHDEVVGPLVQALDWIVEHSDESKVIERACDALHAAGHPSYQGAKGND